MKIPLQAFLTASGLPQIPEQTLLSVVPEHRFAKDQSERHLVDYRFQRACRPVGPRRIRVRPCPEVAMPVSAVMPLHSESKWVSCKAPPIERDLSGKNRVAVRRPREPNPPLIAQGHAKRRTVAQVPGDGMPVHFQRSSAGIIVDAIVSNSKVKRTLPSAADVQSL